MATTKLLTPDQTATLLGISVGTLANWRCRGYGPKFVYVGSRIRYPERRVNLWLAGQESASTAGRAVAG